MPKKLHSFEEPEPQVDPVGGEDGIPAYASSSTKTESITKCRPDWAPSGFSLETDMQLQLVPMVMSNPAIYLSTQTREREKIMTSWEILETCGTYEYQKVTRVKLPYQGLTDFRNFDKFTKVKHLDLSCNYLVKIPKLQYNKELKHLALDSNSISTLENLQFFPQLSTLLLQNNHIKRIGTGLAKRRRLRVLRLDSNEIQSVDVHEMGDLFNLKFLNLSNNYVRELSALIVLPRLEELYMARNHLTSTSDLKCCQSLTEVDLSFNPIIDFSGLEELPNLQTLRIICVGLKTLVSLGNLNELDMLIMCHNDVTTLPTLASQFPKLYLLDIRNNKLEEWDELNYMKEGPELKKIMLFGNPMVASCVDVEAYIKTVQTGFPDVEQLDEYLFTESAESWRNLMKLRPGPATVNAYNEFQASLDSCMNAIYQCKSVMTERLNSVMTVMTTFPPPTRREPNNESSLSQSTSTMMTSAGFSQTSSKVTAGSSSQLESSQPSLTASQSTSSSATQLQIQSGNQQQSQPASLPARQLQSQSGNKQQSQPASGSMCQHQSQGGKPPPRQRVSSSACQLQSQSGNRPPSQAASEDTSYRSCSGSLRPIHFGSLHPTFSDDENSSNAGSRRPSRCGSRLATYSVSQRSCRCNQRLSMSGTQLATHSGSWCPSRCGSQLTSYLGSQYPSRAGSQLGSYSGSQHPSRCGSQLSGHLGSQYPSWSGSQPANYSGSRRPSRCGSHLASNLGSQHPSQTKTQADTENRPESRTVNRLQDALMYASKKE